MSARRNAFVFAAAVLVVLGLAALLRPHVVQRTVPGDGISFTSDYFLTDTHEGDLVAFGQTLTLDPESRIEGAASLVGQTVRVAGAVEGDLTVLGENLALDATSVISGNANLSGRNIVLAGQVSGDLFVNGASLTILPGAVLDGVLSACTSSVTDQRADASPVSCTSTPVIDPFAELIALRSAALGENALAMQFASVQVLALVVVATLALMGSSVLAVTFFPRHISHIEEAMRARPRNFGGVGIAVYALVVGLFSSVGLGASLFTRIGTRPVGRTYFVQG